ncbi:hypothetical protein EGW08_016309 [Elysia chlorotica]|uniref:Methyltransferase-like protein 17, mitochondrial n=1 Tax=Elysia chlorotica TaxID=188477 RepID=A0A3S0ZCS1_ELYCH|nr:hypothetical protein EGW08_016309 [Elysia chlorotica]
MAATSRYFHQLKTISSCRLLLTHQNTWNVNHFTYSLSSSQQSRFLSTNRANEITENIICRETCVDVDVGDILEKNHVGVSGHINYRKHPGVVRRTNSSLPTRLVRAIKVLLEKYPVTSLVAKTDKLVRYLSKRQPPLNDSELSQRTKDIEDRIFVEEGKKFANLKGSELEDALEAHRKIVLSRLRKTVYHWKPMQYDAYTSYIYLLGRIASDFAVQMQCFTEISKRDPDFRPTSIFYHGSKVGAGIWASNEIWPNIGEHYCVDENLHMNTIARLLLQNGNEQEKVMSISGVHFRNFGPSPMQNKFSMVVSAYNLMEQSSPEDRSQIVQDLWKMTDSYLVLIEIGTGAGFKLVHEAREILLQLSEEGGDENTESGHVFAPCPHDKACPKTRMKNQPCLTECAMKNLDFSKKNMPEKPKTNIRYSYLIMKKRPRQNDKAWPRVLHQIKAQRHTHCHLCLPCGELQHVIISKAKYERHLYSCARHVDQGDFLPVSLSRDPIESQEISHSPQESDSLGDQYKQPDDGSVSGDNEDGQKGRNV